MKVYIVIRMDEVLDGSNTFYKECEKVFYSESKAIEYIESQLPENAVKEYDGLWTFRDDVCTETSYEYEIHDVE
jgi:hypothetical protein